MERVSVQYGRGSLEIEIPWPRVKILAPRYLEGLADEQAAFQESVRKPISSLPLRELVSPEERLAIVIPDITRPLPSNRLLPWLLEELSQVSPQNAVILSGTGSHRPNTQAELEALAGPEIFQRYRVINHDAFDPSLLERVGSSLDGQSVLLNRQYTRADRRIVLGFIEPHFMAGFSGGYKGIFPALADIDSIQHYHRASVIGHPRSTWGVLEGNPTQEQIRHNGSLLPVDFAINVTLNRDRKITGFFCGEVSAAHEAGARFARETAMAACEESFPLVVTSNSGYPLDQNLYQTVKGLSAAAQIVQEGGSILGIARCNDGFPDHGNFRKLLFEYSSPRAMLSAIHSPGFRVHDQWEAQLLAMIQLKARVALHCEIPDSELEQAQLEPVGNIGDYLARELEQIEKEQTIAVLPEGPMTIPYLEREKVDAGS